MKRLWLAGLLLCAGCTPAPRRDQPSSEQSQSSAASLLQGLDYVHAADLPTDAAAKAEQDLAAGHCYLYQVYGYSAMILTSSGTLTKPPEGYKIIDVLDTSDAPPPEASAANARAYQFSQTYNDIVMAKCGAKK